MWASNAHHTTHIHELRSNTRTKFKIIFNLVLDNDRFVRWHTSLSVLFLAASLTLYANIYLYICPFLRLASLHANFDHHHQQICNASQVMRPHFMFYIFSLNNTVSDFCIQNNWDVRILRTTFQLILSSTDVEPLPNRHSTIWRI